MKTLTSILLLFQMIMTHPQSLGYRNLSSEEFLKEVDNKNVTLIDTRTQTEFSRGHIRGAESLSVLSSKFEEKILLIPKDQTIYLYCLTGHRSVKAAEILLENGYTKIVNLQPGLVGWKKNDLPLVRKNNTKGSDKNQIKTETFYKLIYAEKPVFVDFYAPWCAPCRKMTPIIDSLETKYQDKLNFLRINIDENNKLLKELDISSTPYLVLYNQGQKVFEHNGTVSSLTLEKEFSKIR